MNAAGSLPPLATAIRQLRMRVLDAQGPGADALIERIRGVARLAEVQREFTAADTLLALAAKLERSRGKDVRQLVYADLDVAQASMQYD